MAAATGTINGATTGTTKGIMDLTENSCDHAQWVYPELREEAAAEIEREFCLPFPIANLLAARGMENRQQVHDHLYGQLPNLHDPSLLHGMSTAVGRILEAVNKGEHILIYGDNDVDGMTGTALLVDFLREIGGQVWFAISDPRGSRQTLIVEAIDYAKEKECSLLITVDCGVTAAEQIQQVVEQGVDVIVTDHHEPTHTIPNCVSTLNPKLLESAYPNRELTGVGVAFKLIHAITNKLASTNNPLAAEIDLKGYLDLVCLGTVSDMGLLTGENRILVRYGLQQLHDSYRIGLLTLISFCGMSPKDVTTGTIASKIAPRLNSLGRISDPYKGVKMLLSDQAETAERLALELDVNNSERQKIERTISADVEALIKDNPDILNNRAIVMDSERWHPGVIAILSTRLAKQYNRPTVIIAIDDGIGKGSIRSIRSFPVLPILKQKANLLINFGGHDVAAGLTIKREDIPEFRQFFIDQANTLLTSQDVAPKLRLDAPIQFSDLTFEFLEAMKLLEPFGNGNPPPIFYCECTQAWPAKVVGKNHLKFYLEQGDRILEGIGFGMAPWRNELRKKGLKLKIAFTPQVNTFQSKTSIQLLIRDFQRI